MKVAQLCLTLCDPMDYTVHEILQARILEWVAFLFSRSFSQPRDRPRFPALQADSLPAEPQGKPKNTGEGSLSLLQWIFLTQELNRGLPHCRQILYQLSYQGSPYGCLELDIRRWEFNTSLSNAFWYSFDFWSHPDILHIQKIKAKKKLIFYCLKHASHPWMLIIRRCPPRCSCFLA